jgi:hypothetical protein
LLSSFKRNLTYIRLHLKKGKNEISMPITHEQEVLTSFLSLDNLDLILVKFPQILELIINYQRLIIKYVINN